jgi:hypothetical protein
VITCAVKPVSVCAEAVLPYAVVRPYSNAVVVDAPFGLTVPLRVAPDCPMRVAASVVTVGAVTRLNVGVIVWVDAAETVHVPVPRHPLPLQPAKKDPGSGVAVRATVGAAKDAEQTAPHWIPAGMLETVPPPDPAFDTVSTWGTCETKDQTGPHSLHAPQESSAWTRQ